MSTYTRVFEKGSSICRIKNPSGYYIPELEAMDISLQEQLTIIPTNSSAYSIMLTENLAAYICEREIEFLC